MIFGAGYSGKAVGASNAARFERRSGTTRSAAKAAALSAAGIEPFIFDGQAIDSTLETALANVTHLVQSIAPGAAGDPLIRLAGDRILDLMPRLQWISYLSTVGVYGDHHGRWVDEETECKPVSDRSVERVAAEKAWMDVSAQTGIPTAIVRLSGIYGPGRNTFVNFAEGTARRLVKKDQVFNRIRVEDIGSAVSFLIERNLGGIFNVTDNEPCPPQDVVTEAARLMGVEPPPEIDFDTAVLSPMARSFYGENKRVSNSKIRSLGFQFQFPDYRTSLQDLWTDGRWRG